MHSPELLDHFRNPRHAGVLDAPAIVIEAENPACGDILRLSARVEDGVFERVAFQVRGCTASIAAGSVLAELLQGRTLEGARQLGTADVERALGGLPPESKHAAVLVIDGLRALLADYNQ